MRSEHGKAPFARHCHGRASLGWLAVAAHVDDLIASRKVKLRTALATRPLDNGPRRRADTAQDGAGIADFVASDFKDLATQLGV